MIRATLVNTQTDSFWPDILSAQQAELKTGKKREISTEIGEREESAEKVQNSAWQNNCER